MAVNVFMSKCASICTSSVLNISEGADTLPSHAEEGLMYEDFGNRIASVED